MSRPRILRSLLFVPGNSWRMIQRARKETEDAAILDLEDAVPIGEKETARWLVKDAVEILKSAGIDVFARVNGLTTGLVAGDLTFVIQEDLDGVMLPKTESREDISKLEGMIRLEEESKGIKLGSVKIIPLIETAKGVFNAYEIAIASARVIALSFGAADYLRDLGLSYIAMSEGETEILYARSYLAVVARAAEIPAIDTPYFGLIIDREGLVKESGMAAKLGFKGKLVIHPSHIEPVNQVFSPSKKEVESAKKIIKVYDEASKRGLGAASFEGRMIDYATYDMAKKLLFLSEAIFEKEKRTI